MAMNPQEVADRWASGLSRAGDKAKAKVSAITESPMEKAAANVSGWQEGVLNAGSAYQAGLRRVSLADWKRAYIEKGVPRMGQGASMAKGKMATFYQQFLPQVEAASKEVRSMPNGTYEERIQRMVAMANAMHALKGTFNG